MFEVFDDNRFYRIITFADLTVFFKDETYSVLLYMD